MHETAWRESGMFDTIEHKCGASEVWLNHIWNSSEPFERKSETYEPCLTCLKRWNMNPTCLKRIWNISETLTRMSGMFETHPKHFRKQYIYEMSQIYERTLFESCLKYMYETRLEQLCLTHAWDMYETVGTHNSMSETCLKLICNTSEYIWYVWHTSETCNYEKSERQSEMSGTCLKHVWTI